MRTPLIVISLAFFLVGLHAIDVPKEKEVIRIDHLEGKKGATEFDHAMHAMHGKKAKNAKGEPLSCVDCHHTAKAGDKVEDFKACTTCHLGVGEKVKMVEGKEAPLLGIIKEGQSSVDRKSILYHQLCVDCHKAVKKNTEGKSIKSCKVCHSKDDDD